MELVEPRPSVRIGTRGSDLARWQASEVSRRLRLAHPGLAVEELVIPTLGDRVQDAPLSKIGDKGLFTRELEVALGAGAIDLAVHSLKDLPTALPAGMALAAVLERDDPRDALVAPAGTSLASLPAGFRVGTSSLRRRAQLLARHPALRLIDARGNLPTRLAKLDRGEYDGLVLARSGLMRLGLEARIAEVIEPGDVMPAVGQGALAIETRAGDGRITALVAALEHRPTRLATSAERACLARLEGGCQVPVGALGTLDGDELTLAGVVADLDGKAVVRDTVISKVRGEHDAARAGTRLAEQLLAKGAAVILARLRVAALAPAESGRGPDA
jgi:hydroxymethylbilane synthase